MEKVKEILKESLIGEWPIDSCLFYLENAIKAIRAGGLKEDDFEKICNDSLEKIKEAKQCRKNTHNALKELKKENLKKKQERTEYYHKHSRFNKEARNDR